MVCPVCNMETVARGARRCQACYRKEMSERNRLTSPQRMRDHNPMRMPGIREAMTKTLREIGHKPIVRGGNGKGPSPAQKALFDQLCKIGTGWVLELPIPTKQPRGSGFPTCYKIDIAHPESKIGVEVDGSSHHSMVRQAQDRKKLAFLSSVGWSVLKLWNEAALNQTEAVAQMILSTTLR